MFNYADFYIQKGPKFVWLGSIVFKGSPDQLPIDLLYAGSTSDYVAAVKLLITSSFDGTDPENKFWPHSYLTSEGTKFSYFWIKTRRGFRLKCSHFGGPIFCPKKMARLLKIKKSIENLTNELDLSKSATKEIKAQLSKIDAALKLLLKSKTTIKFPNMSAFTRSARINKDFTG